MYRSLFGVPLLASETLRSITLRIAEETLAGDADVAPCRCSAAVPVTCGADIEVPLIVAMAVSEPTHADVTLTPGA